MSGHTWHQHITADLDQLRAGLLDLIDCPPTHTVPPRKPTDREIVTTRRGGDRDVDYATPISPRGTTSEPSDPVRLEVERHEWAVTNALTELHQLVDEWTSIVTMHLHPFDLDVHDEHGRPADIPQPPPTRTTTTGRTVVDIGLPRATVEVIICINWLSHAADALAERERTRPSDISTGLPAGLHHLTERTRNTARRHGRTAIQRRANNRLCDDRYDYGCTRNIAHEGPRTTTCNPCQQRAYRDRRQLVDEMADIATSDK